MNKLTLFGLLGASCFSGAAHAQSLAEREASHLRAYRANPKDVGALIKVARLREERGRYTEAAATWNLVQKTFPTSSSRALTMGHSNLLFAESYNSLGARWIARLQTRGTARPQASSSERRAAARAYRKLIKDPLLYQVTRVDMDDDGMPELVYFNRSRPDADGYLALNVDKWNGEAFEHAWVGSNNADRGYAMDYKVVGKRWPTIAVTYFTDKQYGTPAGNIYSDGDTVLSMPY